MKIKDFRTFENTSGDIYYLYEELNISGFVDRHGKILSDNPYEVVEKLNKKYTGLIYLYNPKEELDDLILYVDKYFFGDDKILKLHSTKRTKDIKIHEFPCSYSFMDIVDDYQLYPGDVLYIIETQEPEKPKIRWYKKGKLSNLSEGIRWFSKGKFTSEPNSELPLDTSFIKSQEFMDFLESKGALEEYVKYASENCRKEFYRFFGSRIIDSTLKWDETDSGHEYWSKLSNEWEYYYDDNIREYGDDDNHDDYDHEGDYYENDDDNIDESIRWYKKGKLIHDPNSTSLPVPEYNDFITNDRFRQFLIDHDAYDEYIEYCYPKFKKYFKNELSADIISASMTWADTPGGRRKWQELHDEWYDIYYDENIGKTNEAIRWYKKGKLINDPNITSPPEYDDFITNDEFRRFLIDNKAYEEYIKYCEDSAKTNFDEYFGSLVIDRTLNWYNTDSGSQFWGELHYKWAAFYRSK